MSGEHTIGDQVINEHIKQLSDLTNQTRANKERLNKQDAINDKINDRIDSIQKLQFSLLEVKNGVDRINEKIEVQHEYQDEIVRNLKEDITIQREHSKENTKHIVEALGRVMEATVNQREHSEENTNHIVKTLAESMEKKNSISPWYIVIRDASIYAVVMFFSGLILWAIIQYGTSVNI